MTDIDEFCRTELTRRERLKRATPLCYVTLLPRLIAVGRELGELSIPYDSPLWQQISALKEFRS